MSEPKRSEPKSAAGALGAGLLFGAGLVVSGMADPQKVRAFLDIAGAWDPSLALVMIGAIAIATPAFAWHGRRRDTPPVLSGAPISSTEPAAVADSKLLAGSVLFGVGWGLSGLCPGPALLSILSPNLKGTIFVVAMLGGIWAQQRIVQRAGQIQRANQDRTV